MGGGGGGGGDSNSIKKIYILKKSSNSVVQISVTFPFAKGAVGKKKKKRRKGGKSFFATSLYAELIPFPAPFLRDGNAQCIMQHLVRPSVGIVATCLAAGPLRQCNCQCCRTTVCAKDLSASSEKTREVQLVGCEASVISVCSSRPQGERLKGELGWRSDCRMATKRSKKMNVQFCSYLRLVSLSVLKKRHPVASFGYLSDLKKRHPIASFG